MTVSQYRRSFARRATLLLIDLILIAFATVLALLLRDNFYVDTSNLGSLVPYLLVTLAASIPVLMVLGLDRTVWRFSALTDYLRVMVAVFAIVSAAVVIAFVFNRMEGVARALPVLQGMLMSFLLVGARVLMRLRHEGRRTGAAVASVASPARRETIIVIGMNAVAELYIRSIEEFAADKIKIAGLIARSEHQRGRMLQQYEVLGSPEQVASIVDTLSVHGVAVDRIVIAVPLDSLSEEATESLFALSRASNIRLDFFAERIISPDGPDGANEGTGDDRSLPTKLAFSVDENAVGGGRRFYWVAKRAIDAMASLSLLIVLAPVFAILTGCVLADVGYPAVFWQQRPGRGGRAFRLHKFRTMADAHDQHGRRIPDSQRLSAFGRFLRRTRLDELPQLVNILSGDMSFVGPRPLLPVDQSDEAAARLMVRPGLTGWAQVKGGRIISAEDKAALDVWYVCNASLILDLRVVANTVPMILFGERPNMTAIQQAWADLARLGICSVFERDSNGAAGPGNVMG